MKDRISISKSGVFILLTMILVLTFYPPAQARMLKQFTPTLTISEKYHDNFLKTATDEQEEWITSYELGFSLGILDKTKKMVLSYSPEYKDYKNFDERNSFDHNAEITGSFQPTKQTTIKAELGYDGHDGNNDGESWQHTASASLDSQLTKHTNFSISQSYSKSFDQQERTGDYKEHEVNNTRASIKNTFGEKDSAGLNFNYGFDDYQESDTDEYEQFGTSGFLTYWVTPLNGLDSNISYTNKTLEDSVDDIKTYEGDIRYLRKFTKHVNGYVKYRHYLSRQDSGDHTIYHPSTGFDWDVTEDSGVSFGVGSLFHEWEDGETSTELFFDVDAHKTFDFSRKGSLRLDASSGYEESTGEDINKGFSTYYQARAKLDYKLMKYLSSNLFASCKLNDFQGSSTQNGDQVITYETGFRLSYQILERLSSNLLGSYSQNEYHETDQDRRDNTRKLGGGLTWFPLRWLKFALNYEYRDFKSDSNERDDTTENIVTFSVSLIPQRPITSDRIGLGKLWKSESVGN